MKPGPERRVWLLGWGALLVTGLTTLGQSPPTAFPDTPEGSYRAFVFALATGDPAGLRAVTLPLADVDFQWLLRGEHVPADRVDEFRKIVEEKIKVRVGRPGEMFPLPSGQIIELKAEEFGPDRTVIVQEGTALPTRLQHRDGRWRVNAAPVVAGRKATAAARKRAEDQGKASPRPAP